MRNIVPILTALLSKKSVSGAITIVAKFTLTESAKVSAGVFTTDGVLVNILIPLSEYPAGTHRIYWDGKNYQGEDMPPNNYIVKVNSNNVQYTWEGSHIGNTSTDKTGSKVHRVYSNLSDIVIAGTKAVYVSDYSEQVASVYSFDTALPQEKINIYPVKTSTADTIHVTTDGVNVYYSGFDAYATNNTFMYATKLSDNSPVNFSAGVDYSLSEFGTQFRTAGLSSTPNSLIGGMAAQSGSNYVYFTRPALNQIVVINATTGATVRTITGFTNPKSVAFDNSGYLWVSSGTNTVAKYLVNGDGTLTLTGVTITGVIDPGKISVNAGSTIVGVIDYSSQTLKTFSNSTGADNGLTIGTPGGYVTNSAASNTKFCFKTVNYGRFSAGFCFSPDGSIWIVDSANFRMMHFSSSGVFIEAVYIPGPSYYTNVDSSDTIRVFRNFLEYTVNYSQELSGSSGWVLANNWGATIPSTYDHFQAFCFVKTIAGRTFAAIKLDNQSLIIELVELMPNGTPRYTGITFTSFVIIDKDNNLIEQLIRYSFIGLDVDNNPTWEETGEVLAYTDNLTDNTPLQGLPRRNYVTSDNKVAFYNPNIRDLQSNYYTGAHLGIMQKGSNHWLSLNAYGTYGSYSGNFPPPEFFDVGNSVNNNAGTCMEAMGKNIITGYGGENWRFAQVNEYNHYWSNGLAIGQFGTTGAQSLGEAPAMMEGNAKLPQIVPGSNSDTAYLYHGGESYHGGLHRWKITGLNTIVEESIQINYPSASLVAPALEGIDLMDGLVFGTVLERGNNGWTGDAEENTGNTEFNVIVGLTSPDRKKPDLAIKYSNGNNVPKSISRVLQTSPVALSSWELYGSLNLFATEIGNSFQGGAYMEVLDDGSLVISRLYLNFVTFGTVLLSANDKTLFSKSPEEAVLLTSFTQPFSIRLDSGSLIFTYAGFIQTTSTLINPSADKTKPTTLRFYFFEVDGVQRGRTINVSKMVFVNG